MADVGSLSTASLLALPAALKHSPNDDDASLMISAAAPKAISKGKMIKSPV